MSCSWNCQTPLGKGKSRLCNTNSNMLPVSLGRVADFSDEDEEFSSNEEGEGSDSETMLEERRSRKTKMPVNARVSFDIVSDD